MHPRAKCPAYGARRRILPQARDNRTVARDPRRLSDDADVHDRRSDAMIRHEFTHLGRHYVAIRHKQGRVELYRVDEGLEMFVRYAAPSKGKIDLKAISLCADK